MTEESFPQVVRVVVVDDHEMILQSVVRLLTADARIDVVGTAQTAVEGIEVVTQLCPDVLVLDYHLPDMEAPEAIGILRVATPTVKVVTISGSDRPGSYFESMQAGSAAWVRKTRAIQELRQAILRVAAGEPYVRDEIEADPDLDQLLVHYQPIVSLVDKVIVGFEALVRWQHPDRGLLFPDAFLPHTVETGFVEEIDRWVIQQATGQLALWQEKFPRPPRLFVSVNLSACSLTNSRLAENISTEIDHSGIQANDVVVELQESFLVDRPAETLALLTKLSAIGTRLAIADFGAPLSKISYVHRIPFQCVKIARSFTRELPAATGTVRSIDAVANVAQSMSSMCIAEGVEKTSQFDALCHLGVQFGQGFLFSPPVRSVVCDVLLARTSLTPPTPSSARTTNTATVTV
jgi:EAL domain-containing protein (putative c-di-GMP-specific phosphodiesterase class I)